MTSNYVNLSCQEHLPPVLNLIADPSYQYSRHKHTKEATNEGILHTYSVIISNAPLAKNVGNFELKDNTQNPINQASNIPISRFSTDELVSQISSTTTSEGKNRTLSKLPAFGSSNPLKNNIDIPESNTPPPNQYFSLPSITSSISTEGSKYPSTKSSVSSDSSSMTMPISIPKFTYSSANMKSTRSGKFVMMVQVKFLFLHRDVFGRSAQSCFTDEFSSDTPLEDVITNFHELCTRQNFRLKKKGDTFKPRVSYCVGELKHSNSKPVEKNDLKKTLAQLASSTTVVQFALIVNNMDS